ncbi:MAG TPA: hypothetical protein DIV40_06370, partial [Clostridiales bacterium]|nr:hypothetical protein [Clostridiales bacterium]
EWKCNKCGKYHWSTIKVCECGQTFEQNEKELKDRQQQIKAEQKKKREEVKMQKWVNWHNKIIQKKN